MNKEADTLYLTAREAAAELSISTATLYAYVSRGVIRSEPTSDSRIKRYRAEDVRALKDKRAPGSENKGNGSDGSVLDSAISTITAEGPLYRGALATRLAEHATLEETATLLWGFSGSNPFTARNLPPSNPAICAVRNALKDAAPLSRAIALAALGGEADMRAFNRSEEGRAEAGARVMRLVAAACLGTEPSGDPIHLQIARTWDITEKTHQDLIRRALVLLAEHELNASAYTVRCATSTGINLYDATAAGLAAVKGPRHGGQGPLAARLLHQMAEVDIESGIRERVSLGEGFPGFGHTVYENGDPRGENLLSALTKAGAEKRLSVELPRLVRESTGLFPTIDYALAVMTHLFGLPPGQETVVFAIARTAGWIAHAFEQQDANRLIRPRARYVGPPPSRRDKAEAL
ncbi:citrate synthase family protein [Rhizobium sp. L1K21]|uniref:citrate synthase family protein n=1 Tax=Rhizobium sp. L1K21 TaxID=2954933 RepID=UPI002093F801|nr:citrate synthase family protein [Rhizobium sp. L1K21]MCO6184768.1 citrate synthase family protein [Rhizobium sp. L1K21]